MRLVLLWVEGRAACGRRAFLAFLALSSKFTDREMEGLKYDLVVKSIVSFIRRGFLFFTLACLHPSTIYLYEL